MGGLVRTSAPEEESVSLAEMKLFLRIEGDTSDDVLISSMVKAAREKCEKYTERSFVNSDFEFYLDEFPCGAIVLPLANVSEAVVSYIDQTTGLLGSFAEENYQLDSISDRNRIVLAPGSTWPSVKAGIINPVLVEFTAGYGSAASDVPEGIKTAIKQLAAHYYENRNLFVTGTIVNEIPSLIKSLLWDFRVKEW